MKDLMQIKDFLLKKLIPKDEKSFEYFYNLGVDAYEKKDFEKAIKYFKSAQEKKDIKPQVYYNLALTYQSVKLYDKAIVAYQKFLEANPSDYDGLYNLALVFYTNENFSKSIKYFKKCVEIKKEKDGIKALILAFLSNKEIENAIDFSEKILNSSENSIELYFEIAKVFENKKTSNKDFTYIDIAIEMFTLIIQKNPTFVDAYISTSNSYAKKGEWQKAVDFCAKALEVNPNSFDANSQMGLLYYCQNNTAGAINCYEKALELKPNGDYNTYSSLAYAYEKIGNYDKAIKMFTLIISKFPQAPAKDEIKNHLRILKNL